jgi:glycosyltransferase involved in cell wall biosynthesis
MLTVSVIIPTYNAARTIERTIRSVLNQTFRDIEVIVVDDASTDNTAEIVSAAYGADPKVSLTRLPVNSGGPPRPRNVGISKASGRIIGFLDQDDVYLPEKLARQIAVLDSGSYNYVSCLCWVYDETLRRITGCAAGHTFGNYLFRREVFQTIGLMDEEGLSTDDTLWFLRHDRHYISRNQPVPCFHIEEPLLVHTRHERQLTSFTTDKLRDFIARQMIVLTALDRSLTDPERPFRDHCALLLAHYLVYAGRFEESRHYLKTITSKGPRFQAACLRMASLLGVAPYQWLDRLLRWLRPRIGVLQSFRYRRYFPRLCAEALKIIRARNDGLTVSQRDTAEDKRA